MKCHICEGEDVLANLTQISVPHGVTASYAHSRCIDRHNKRAAKNLRAFDVSTIASHVRDHDLDATDEYVVAKFLREHDSELRDLLFQDDLKFDKRFATEVAAKAYAQRNEDDMNTVFDKLEERVDAWSAENKDFVAGVAEGVAEDLAPILDRIAGEGSDWQPDGTIETEAARCAAVLLIKQVARRKQQAEFEAGHKEHLKSEASDEAASLV